LFEDHVVKIELANNNLTGLNPEQTYYFVVETVTDSHTY